jgi:hypothetical protein
VKLFVAISLERVAPLVKSGKLVVDTRYVTSPRSIKAHMVLM